MGTGLYQYRTVESAWSTLWLPWLERNGDVLTSGHPALVVVDHAQQIGWLKYRAMSEGVSFSGLEWVTASGLRRWLAAYLGIDFDPLGRENLEFILRLNGDENGPLARGPGEALAALDELGRAGGTEHTRIGSDPLLKLGATALIESGGWTPALEDSMLKASQKREKSILSILVTGWGAGHVGDGRLLVLASRLTKELTVSAPAPRFLGGEDADARWISWLEEHLGEASEMCDEIGEDGLYQGFVDSLVMETGEKEVDLPTILIGYDPSDQARHVVEWLSSFPFNASRKGNIACIVPGEGESLSLIGDALAQAGIPAHQEVGETASSGSFQTFHQMLALFLRNSGDVEIGLDLLEWLRARGETKFEQIEIGELRALAVERFRFFQHRSLSRWQDAVDPDNSEEESVLADLGALSRDWHGERTWEDWRERYRSAAGWFGFNADYLEPVWSKIDQILKGRQLSSTLFLDYISSLLEVPGEWRPTDLERPLARLRLTTPEMAVGRTWEGWVWMNAHEGAWPPEIRENPFFPDSKKRVWNREMHGLTAPLLTGSERAACKRRLVLDLLENTRGPVCFTGSLTDGAAPELHSYPNEWVSQILLRSDFGESEALARWTARKPADRSQIKSPYAKLPPVERITEVTALRRNPHIVPGAYEFVFGSAESEVPSVSASEGEWLLAQPGAWALKKRFDAVPRQISDFCRSDGLLLGIWTHASVADTLQGMRGRALKEIEHLSTPSNENQNGVSSDLRLELLREKSKWMARSCLEQLIDHYAGLIVEEVEYPLPRVVIETIDGPLEIRGRVDLLLRQNEEQVVVIDFKTGSSGGIPTPKMLAKKAEGLQYAAYLRLLTDEPNASARVIQPLGGSDRELTQEQASAASPHWRTLVRMFSAGFFPLRTTSRSEYGGGGAGFPISTVPINESILASKWDLWMEESES